MLDFGQAYQERFIDLMYIPFYSGLIDQENAAETDLGCKVQLAETIIFICLLPGADEKIED